MVSEGYGGLIATHFRPGLSPYSSISETELLPSFVHMRDYKYDKHRSSAESHVMVY